MQCFQLGSNVGGDAGQEDGTISAVSVSEPDGTAA
jgi:hypothetical protein